jgi:cystathionine beta-lyase/cystathionine gamma-synthase
MRTTPQNIGTQVVHAGEPSPRLEGAVSIPIFQSSVFETAGEADYHDIKYIRLGNTPNHHAVQAKLAALENGASAVVTASGMGAITTTILALVAGGQHLLTQSSLYAGLPNFLDHEAARFGISYDTIDIDKPETWEAMLRPTTKVIYIETLANPLLRVPDFNAVTEFAKKYSLISIIDNTFATPINFRPLERGFDLCVHSCTKYLNGHSDLVAGAVIGKEELIKKIYHSVVRLGPSLNPISCFLLHRALKTLAVRVRQQNSNALAVAEFLEKQPGVSKVYYPGLKSHQDHERACHYFDGFGGMLSFELAGGPSAVQRLYEHLKLPVVAPSLGGVETSITSPAATSHYCISKELREMMGVTDSLLRLSVGIEDVSEIVADFANALRRL